MLPNKIALPLSAYCKENYFKLLLFDIGILGALLELTPQDIIGQDIGSFKGFRIENNHINAPIYMAGSLHQLITNK